MQKYILNGDVVYIWRKYNEKSCIFAEGICVALAAQHTGRSCVGGGTYETGCVGGGTYETGCVGGATYGTGCVGSATYRTMIEKQKIEL